MAAYSINFIQNLFQRFTSSLALSEATVFLNLVMSFLGNVIHKAIHNNHLLFLLFCNNSGLFPAFVANNFSSQLNFDNVEQLLKTTELELEKVEYS